MQDYARGVQCNIPLCWIYVHRSWDYKSYDNEAKTHLGIFNPKTGFIYHCMLKPLPVRKFINRCTCKLKQISWTLYYVIRTCIKHVGQNSDKSGSGTSSIGRTCRPLVRWRWKMAALPLPVAILDDLISGPEMRSSKMATGIGRATIFHLHLTRGRKVLPRSWMTSSPPPPSWIQNDFWRTSRHPSDVCPILRKGSS